MKRIQSAMRLGMDDFIMVEEVCILFLVTGASGISVAGSLGCLQTVGLCFDASRARRRARPICWVLLPWNAPMDAEVRANSASRSARSAATSEGAAAFSTTE